MDKIHTFSLAYADENTSKNVSELKEVLSRIGIAITLDGENLHIGYNQEKVNEKLSRGAGRKEKVIPVRVGQINEMRKTMTIEAICTKIGISRASFYRRMRHCEEFQYNDDELFI